MSSYRGTADRPDKAKAIAAVVAVHVALAAAILTGLNVHTVRRAVEQLKTFDIASPRLRHRCRPRPRHKATAARRPCRRPGAQGRADAGRRARSRRSRSSRQSRPPRSPAPAASPSSGASTSGTGTGAGGAGTGPGGGGRRFFAVHAGAADQQHPEPSTASSPPTGIHSGSVGVTIKVNTDGSVSNCRIARSSGNPSIDGLDVPADPTATSASARRATPPAARSRRTSPISRTGAAAEASGRRWRPLPCCSARRASCAASRP